MEERDGADEIGPSLQHDAARGLGIFELVDARKVPVDEHGVGQRPQMLRRLEFGGVRRQKVQMDMIGHAPKRARHRARASVISS